MPRWRLGGVARRRHDLARNGLIVVVDFHASPVPVFKRWIACNHVRMDGHLLPALGERFSVLRADTDASYGAPWSRFTFPGRTPGGRAVASAAPVGLAGPELEIRHGSTQPH